MLFCICAILYNFYPRPPRGGRHGHVYPSLLRANFYPRPPRGGRRSRLPRARHLQAISIHALREEGDFRPHGPDGRSLRNFYPRPPRGGRPGRVVPTVRAIHFYPRPPRGGRPSPPASVYSPSANFYPRPPRGGRRSNEREPDPCKRFLSTPSARRATPLALGYQSRA